LSTEGGDPEISVVVVREMSMEVEKKAEGNNPGGGLTDGRSGCGVDTGVGLGVGVADDAGDMVNVSVKF
jgi:hypothetical protein